MPMKSFWKIRILENMLSLKVAIESPSPGRITSKKRHSLAEDKLQCDLEPYFIGLLFL